MSLDRMLIIICSSVIGIMIIGIFIAYSIHNVKEYIKRKKGNEKFKQK